MPHLAYLSLGSNIGDREQNLRVAIERLQKIGHVHAVSSYYETEPVDVTDQAWFVNCAVALETPATPAELMTQLLEIEHAMGRKRVHKKGPRTIDIDILLFGDVVLDTPEVTIPHPAMHQRRFVLVPVAEIAPGLMHPVLKKTIESLRRELPEGQIVKKFKEN